MLIIAVASKSMQANLVPYSEGVTNDSRTHKTKGPDKKDDDDDDTAPFNLFQFSLEVGTSA